MTIKDLKEYLGCLDENMEVMIGDYTEISDYEPVLYVIKEPETLFDVNNKEFLCLPFYQS